MKISLDLEELDKLIDERIQKKLESVLNLIPQATWSFNDFKKNTDFKSSAVARDFLTYYEKSLIEANALFPRQKGEHWKINTSNMIDWLREHESEVWKNKKQWRVS